MSGNYKVIPEQAKVLEELEKIIGNPIPQLTTLPESFGNLKSLQNLYLYANKLTILPESFGNPQSLKELYLNRNKLMDLLDSFNSLKSLQRLDLKLNELEYLP